MKLGQELIAHRAAMVVVATVAVVVTAAAVEVVVVMAVAEVATKIAIAAAAATTANRVGNQVSTTCESWWVKGFGPTTRKGSTE